MNKPSKFIRTLYEILETKSNECLINWSQDGKSFIIQRVPAFQKQIIEEYFSAKNEQSFFRQLRVYGFKMRKNACNRKEYYHPKFIKHNFKILHQIKRKSLKHNENSNQDLIIVQNRRFIDELESIQTQQLKLQKQVSLNSQIHFLIVYRINQIIEHYIKTSQFENIRNYYIPIFIFFKLVGGMNNENWFSESDAFQMLQEIIACTPLSEYEISPFIIK